MTGMGRVVIETDMEIKFLRMPSGELILTIRERSIWERIKALVTWC